MFLIKRNSTYEGWIDGSAADLFSLSTPHRSRRHVAKFLVAQRRSARGTEWTRVLRQRSLELCFSRPNADAELMPSLCLTLAYGKRPEKSSTWVSSSRRRCAFNKRALLKKRDSKPTGHIYSSGREERKKLLRKLFLFSSSLDLFRFAPLVATA